MSNFSLSFTLVVLALFSPMSLGKSVGDLSQNCQKTLENIPELHRRHVEDDYFLRDEARICLEQLENPGLLNCFRWTTDDSKNFDTDPSEKEWERLDQKKTYSKLPVFIHWPPDKLNAIENQCQSEESADCSLGFQNVSCSQRTKTGDFKNTKSLHFNGQNVCEVFGAWTIVPVDSRISVPGGTNKFLLFHRMINGMDQYISRFVDEDRKDYSTGTMDGMLVLPPDQKNPFSRTIFQTGGNSLGHTPANGVCMKCHANGPRVPQPVPGSPQDPLDRAQLDAFRKKILFAGRMDLKFNGVNVPGSGPHFGKGACTKCHTTDPYSNESRNPLTERQTNSFSEVRRSMTELWMPIHNTTTSKPYFSALEKVDLLAPDDRKRVSNFFSESFREGDGAGTPIEGRKYLLAIKNMLSLLVDRGKITGTERDTAYVAYEKAQGEMRNEFRELFRSFQSEFKQWRHSGGPACDRTLLDEKSGTDAEVETGK